MGDAQRAGAARTVGRAHAAQVFAKPVRVGRRRAALISGTDGEARLSVRQLGMRNCGASPLSLKRSLMAS